MKRRCRTTAFLAVLLLVFAAGSACASSARVLSDAELDAIDAGTLPYGLGKLLSVSTLLEERSLGMGENIFAELFADRSSADKAYEQDLSGSFVLLMELLGGQNSISAYNSSVAVQTNFSFVTGHAGSVVQQNIANIETSSANHWE